MRRCPYCDEEIREAAIKCPHCREDLTEHRISGRRGGSVSAVVIGAVTAAAITAAGFAYLGNASPRSTDGGDVATAGGAVPTQAASRTVSSSPLPTAPVTRSTAPPSPTPTPTMPPIKLLFDVMGDSNGGGYEVGNGGTCFGVGVDDRFAEGALVEVIDGIGQVLVRTQLGDGREVNVVNGSRASGWACRFTVYFSGLPVRDRYGVAIAGDSPTFFNQQWLSNEGMQFWIYQRA